MDPRYQSQEVKARIATLYVPLIGIVIDALPQLCIDSRPPVQQQESVQLTSTEDTHGIDETVAMAIAGSSVYNIPGKSSASVVIFHHVPMLFLSRHVVLLQLTV